jgi:hypothetical protein
MNLLFYNGSDGKFRYKLMGLIYIVYHNDMYGWLKCKFIDYFILYL